MSVTATKVLRLAGTGSFLSAAGASLMGIALPSLARRFGVTLESAQGLMLAYTVTVTFCLLPFGVLADRAGLAKVAKAGFLGFAVASAVLVVAPSFAVMLAVRAVQGASAALLMASMPAWLSQVVAPNERGRALGLSGSATYVGLTMGPVLGGVLVDLLGPQGIFVLLVPIALVAALTVNPAEHAPAAGDELARGARETSSTRPSIGALFSVPDVTRGAFAAYLQYATTFAVAAQIPFFLQDERGLSARQAGLVAVIQPLVMVVASPLAGRGSDRFGARPFVVAGSLVCAFAAFLVRAAVPSASLVVVGIGLGALGLGAGLFASPNNASLLAAAPPRLRGSASALVALARNAGMVTGVLGSSRVLTLVAGSARPHGPAFVEGYRAALVLAILFGLLSAVVSYSRASARSEAERAG